MNATTFAKKHIYRQLVKKYISGLDYTIDPTKKTILALNHFYDQDLRALANANSDYNFIVVDAPQLARGGKLYYDSDVIRMEVPYSDTSDKNRLMWRDECRYIFDSLNRRFNIDIIITPSDIFWWIRELITVAKENGVKTVVIDKEGLISPFDFDAEAKRIRERAPFMSDHIYVWSDRQRQYWNKIGVSDDKITILGQPRSDLFHHEHNRVVDSYFQTPQPLITFFSYEDTAYIPPYLIKQGLTWQVMKKQTHDFVYELSKRNPHYNFVIKTHPQQSDLAALQERYSGDNIAVIGGAQIANELIQRSELIIAFQTTGVIEAMFMNRRVIYTYWDPNYEQLRDDVLPYHDAPGIIPIGDFNEFKIVCTDFFTGDTARFEFDDKAIQARDAFVDTYLYRPDGRVCDRFFATIGRFVG
ncbi:MAG: hypothetical protein R3F48_02280 [Candidatus Zixiibacteriota bacterium]